MSDSCAQSTPTSIGTQKFKTVTGTCLKRHFEPVFVCGDLYRAPCLTTYGNHTHGIDRISEIV